MLHHVGQAADAYRHLKEIIKSCACTESDLPGGMATWSAFSSPRQLPPEDESPRVQDPPPSPPAPETAGEGAKAEAADKRGPAEPAFDDRTTVSTRLQRRVELLMNCSLTTVDLVSGLPKELQLEAVDFCGSVFGALARQSIGNLQERQRRRLLLLKLQENRRKAKRKQLASSKKAAEKPGSERADVVGAEREEDESGLVDRLEEWGGEERRRAAETNGDGFTGALLTLGRKLLGQMRNRNMRQQEGEVMSLLLQFTELKFGEESGTLP